VGVHEFLKDHYSQEELEKIFLPPKPKMDSLVEMVEKAREAKRGNE
jgi:hypothetical protein